MSKTQKTIRIGLVVLSLVVLVGPTSCFSQTPQPSSQQQNIPSLGETQLNLLLQDRPQLQSILQRGNPIWNWVQAAFGDTSKGFQIRWNNGAPPNDYVTGSASSAFPKKGISYIWVNKIYKTGTTAGLMRSPEEVLSDLVFELYNVRHGPENREIDNRLESGTISREDYIRACVKIEYLADQETATFYSQIWVPFCQAKGFPYTARLWHTSIPSNFEAWLSQYPRDFWYPWKYYGDRYDRDTIERAGDFKFGQENWNEAINDYAQSISLGGIPYYRKALAEMAEGNLGLSLGDFRQVGGRYKEGTWTRDYSQIFIWLIQMRRGQKADADHELSDYFAKRPVAVQNNWVSKIAQFLLGQSSEIDFISSASSADPKEEQMQSCAALYYVGIKHLLTGDKLLAADCLRKCLIKKQANFVLEQVLAYEELTTLEQTK